MPLFDFIWIMGLLNCILFKRQIYAQTFVKKGTTQLLDYELSSCMDQKVTQNEDKSNVITLRTKGKLQYICLNKPIIFYNRKIFKDTEANMKFWQGHLCDSPNLMARGYIRNSCFYGHVATNDNTTLYIENKPPDIISEMDLIMYTNYDVPELAYGHDHVHYNDEPKENMKMLRASSDYVYNPNQKYCSLSLYILDNFLRTFNSRDDTILTVTQAVHFINEQLEKYADAGIPGMLSYEVADIYFVTDNELGFEQSQIDPDRHVTLFNDYLEQKTESSCQSMLFSAHNYDGTLGIAYVGTARGVGICGIRSGVLITRKHNSVVSNGLLYRTMLHELFHTYGSQHDPLNPCTEQNQECPGGIDDNVCVGDLASGRFLMYPLSTMMGGPRTYMVSKCTVKYIQPFYSLETRRHCLKEIPFSGCGNGVLEEGEECDPGPKEDHCCTDKCLLKPGMMCTPVNGKCCSESCQYKPMGTICLDATDCSLESRCHGNSIECPDSMNRQEGAYCEDYRGTCFEGSCSGSVCAKNSLADCFSEDPREYCIITCLNRKSECVPIMIMGSYRQKLPESPCRNNTGICMKDGVCYLLKADSHLSKFMEYLINGKLFLDIKSYYENHFIAMIFIILATITFIFVLAVSLRSNKIEKANKINTDLLRFNNVEVDDSFGKSIRKTLRYMRRG